MNKILINNESRFLINRDRLKETVEKFLVEQNVKTAVELSIAIVGDRKMRTLNKKYCQLDQTTPVLSFNLEEGKAFVSPPNKILYLGDIIVSYPQTVLLAAEENKLVDQKLAELVEHGLKSLLGL